MKTSIFPFEISLIRPLLLKGNAFLNRSGLLVVKEDEHGNRGYGEISPLPYFSQESYAEVIQHPQNLNFPSVNCGFFQANAELHALQQNITLPQFLLQKINLDLKLSPQVQVNGLIDAQEKAPFITETQRILALGYTTVKLKVGRTSVQQDLNRITWLNEVSGSSLQIRLDANQAWSLKEALLFAKRTSSFPNIEYIEEPCKTFEATQTFHKESGFPVAIDESLYQQNPESALHFAPFAHAFILKPMLLPNFWQHFSDLVKNKQKVVISSSFESGIGMRLLIALAALSGETAGLDPYHWIAKDLLLSPIPIENGAILLEQIFKNPPILDLGL